MDLVIALVNTRRYRTASWIRDNVAGYGSDADGDDAFARMFERDKQELRDLGIPIETGPGGDGYRIEPGEFTLPPMDLTAAESAALAVAARLWETTALREIGGSAWRKVRDAEGIDDDAAPPWTATVQARLRTAEPAFADLFDAIRTHRAVRFDYRGVRDRAAVVRSVEPWGLVSVRGSWYLVGLDTDRRDRRTFRLSRIASSVTAVGRAGAVRIPDGLDLRNAVALDHDETPDAAALLRIRRGAAAGLRRIATVTETSDGSEYGSEYDDVRVPMPSLMDLARRVAAHGSDVVAVDPAELRDAVRLLLQAVVGAS